MKEYLSYYNCELLATYDHVKFFLGWIIERKVVLWLDVIGGDHMHLYFLGVDKYLASLELVGTWTCMERLRWYLGPPCMVLMHVSYLLEVSGAIWVSYGVYSKSIGYLAGLGGAYSHLTLNLANGSNGSNPIQLD